LLLKIKSSTPRNFSTVKIFSQDVEILSSPLISTAVPSFRLDVAWLGPDLLRSKLWLLYADSRPRKIPRIPGKWLTHDICRNTQPHNWSQNKISGRNGKRKERRKRNNGRLKLTGGKIVCNGTKIDPRRGGS
jgi:hypothetical protein